jgi:hypothetical protein
VNVDIVYSYLIDLTWLFLGVWVLLLTTAAIVAFTDWRWMEILPLMDTLRRN